jgi:hypothetical protein
MDEPILKEYRQDAVGGFVQKSVVIVFSLVSITLTICLFLRAGMHWAIFYNEGWNAGLVDLWLSGGPLYHPASALVTNNYPPISFLAVAAVMRLVPDAVFAGRLISALAFLAVVGLIWRINVILWRDGLAALAGALVFAAFMSLNFDYYVGTDDPQMLALAIALAGLLVIMSHREGALAPVASGCLFAVALFTKHNTVALPIAVALWLLVYDRPAFWRFTLAGIAASVALLLAFRGIFGGDFIAGLLYPRQYVLSRAFRQSMAEIGPLEGLIVLGWLGVVLPGRCRGAVFAAIYLVIAVGVAAIELGGSGVGVNAVFDILVACALAGAQLVARLRQSARLRSWALAGLAACTLFSPGLADGKDMLAVPSWLAAMRARERQTEAMIDILRAHPGPALCETNIFCYWAGKPFALDISNFNEGLRAGVKTDAEVVRRIATGEYGVIQLFGSVTDDFVRSPEVRRAIARRYHQAASPIANNFVFIRNE